MVNVDLIANTHGNLVRSFAYRSAELTLTAAAAALMTNIMTLSNYMHQVHPLVVNGPTFADQQVLLLYHTTPKQIVKATEYMYHLHSLDSR